MARMYPFIVYGTLREGASRARVWRAHASAQRGLIEGYELRDTGRRYPVVVPAPDARVVIDVLHATTFESYEYLLARFDEIEDVTNGLYVRTLQMAVVDGHRVTGWLYGPGPSLTSGLAAMPVIASGDWSVR